MMKIRIMQKSKKDPAQAGDRVYTQNDPQWSE